MKLNRNLEEYIASSQEDLKALIRDLCRIPAPSNHEEKRAEFCKAWFESCGGSAFIDDALNAICPYNMSDDKPVVVFMAHTDTVFPDIEPMPFKEENGKMHCPGVTDDTANLAVLMICARYVIMNGITSPYSIVFVANSGEEGLGNLKGSRAVAERYGDRMNELITLDGKSLNGITDNSVGSHRYHVTVETEGGHSFAAFGNQNAIFYLASMIDTLYAVKVPIEGNSHTTYNVGTIAGGTSVNTIAQKAEMLYEYRSDNKACLCKMHDMFSTVLEAYRAMGINVSCEVVGERPCAGDVDKKKLQTLIDRAADSVREELNLTPVFYSASTDCNIPLAAGIPAICMGVCIGDGLHTREEWLDIESLKDGSRLFMHFLMKYFNV